MITNKDAMPELPEELHTTMQDAFERFAFVAQDVLARFKNLPKSRDLAAAMIANLAQEACTAGHGVMRLAKEVHEIEERMEMAEYEDAGEDGEIEEEDED